MREAASDPEAVDDTALTSELRRDPVRGLPAVLARYQTPLLRHATAVVADRAAAQDVVQESFLRLLANGHRVDNLGAWLHRVTHNLALDYLRKESRLKRLHRAASAGPEPLAPPADQPLERQEAWRLVQQELARLTPNERAVVFLKVKEGRSYREISAITGLSTSNVGYLIHQGLKKLAARLKASTGASS
jgi:RNA polymerase sigma factor (sigma-70 family)